VVKRNHPGSTRVAWRKLLNQNQLGLSGFFQIPCDWLAGRLRFRRIPLLEVVHSHQSAI